MIAAPITLAHPLLLHDVIAKGIKRMQAEAQETMELVREATGLKYTEEFTTDTVDIFGEGK